MQYITRTRLCLDTITNQFCLTAFKTNCLNRPVHSQAGLLAPPPRIERYKFRAGFHSWDRDKLLLSKIHRIPPVTWKFGKPRPQCISPIFFRLEKNRPGIISLVQSLTLQAILIAIKSGWISRLVLKAADYWSKDKISRRIASLGFVGNYWHTKISHKPAGIRKHFL